MNYMSNAEAQVNNSGFQLTQFEQLYIVGSENLNMRLITQLFDEHFSRLGIHIIPEVNIETCKHEMCMVLINCHEFTEDHLLQQLNDLYKHRSDLPVLLMNVDSKRPIEQAAEMPNVRAIFESHCDQSQLVNGLKAVDQGQLWLPRSYSDYLLKKLRLTPVGREMEASLTKREIEIITLVSKGYTNEEIANSLFLSAHTIKTHLYRIYKKIGAKNRFQAMEWARMQMPTGGM